MVERGERLQVMLTSAELHALDEWRFVRRMPSRAAAIRELLKRGLAADGWQSASGRGASTDFGVLEDPSPALASQGTDSDSGKKSGK